MMITTTETKSLKRSIHLRSSLNYFLPYPLTSCHCYCHLGHLFFLSYPRLIWPTTHPLTTPALTLYLSLPFSSLSLSFFLIFSHFLFLFVFLLFLYLFFISTKQPIVLFVWVWEYPIFFRDFFYAPSPGVASFICHSLFSSTQPSLPPPSLSLSLSLSLFLSFCVCVCGGGGEIRDLTLFLRGGKIWWFFFFFAWNISDYNSDFN